MLHSEYRKQKTNEFKERMELRNKKKAKEEGTEEPAVKDEKFDKRREREEHVVKGALIKFTDLPDGMAREQLKEKWYEATNEEEFKVANNFICFASMYIIQNCFNKY